MLKLKRRGAEAEGGEGSLPPLIFKPPSGIRAQPIEFPLCVMAEKSLATTTRWRWLGGGECRRRWPGCREGWTATTEVKFGLEAVDSMQRSFLTALFDD
jgi:hypothetical protein